ncbi:MAG TPA: helix-turn-helix domain-containing protein [Candidatus Saccharimonadales bacterium]
MNRVLVNCLLQLDCNEKHIKFYTANLELGAATLVEITKKARLQRSTAYIIAAEMVARGFVNEDHKTYKKLFTAAEPDLLLQKLEARHRQIGRSTIALKEALPELRAAHRTTTTRPRVRTFEGKEGLTAVWKDILSEQQDILLWTNQETEGQVFGRGTHEQFITERVAKGIPIRVLAVRNREAQALISDDATCLRQTKLLPEGVYFTSETYIYGNKVAVLDIGKNIFGVVTENEQIASSQRALFELTWAQS